MGTNSAPGNPLFFEQPPPRTMTLEHSWTDQEVCKTHRASWIYPSVRVYGREEVPADKFSRWVRL